MSMAGVLAYRHNRNRSAFVFSMTDGAYNTDKLIEFLTELRTHFAGEKVNPPDIASGSFDRASPPSTGTSCR